MQKQPKLQQSESAIQQQIVRYYRNSFCLRHHVPRSMILSIPNESSGHRAIKLIQTGLYPGCADLVVLHIPVYDQYTLKIPRILFIECKTNKGKQSEKQIEFEEHCKEIGVEYHIVRSLEEFKSILS